MLSIKSFLSAIFWISLGSFLEKISSKTSLVSLSAKLFIMLELYMKDVYKVKIFFASHPLVALHPVVGGAGVFLGNSRILVIASEAKQSLGILDRKVIIFYTFSLSLQIISS